MPPPSIDRQVGEDAEQPSLEGSGPVVPIKRRPDANERLLRKILCVACISHHAIGRIVCAMVTPLEELFKLLLDRNAPWSCSSLSVWHVRNHPVILPKLSGT